MTETSNITTRTRLRPATRWIVGGLVAIAVGFALLAWLALRPVIPEPLALGSEAPAPATSPATASGTPTPSPKPTASPAPIDLSDREEPMVTRPPQTEPTHLSVDSVGISTDLENLGLFEDGSLATPQNTDLAGWYSGGARPGAVGPAVIAGHVSWNGDPSVFFHLSKIAVGDQITVTQQDDSEVSFSVTRVEQHPKDEFPTLEVYGNTATPQLRLITCGGDFDNSSGHFYDNVIVFAEIE